MELAQLQLFGIIILPYIFVAVGFALALRAAHHLNSPTRLLLLCPLICSCAITIGFMVWGHHAIMTSRSSTAAVGYIFLPVYSISVAAAALAISWSFVYLGYFIIERTNAASARCTNIGSLLIAILVLSVTGFVVYAVTARHRLLNAASAPAAANSLEPILSRAISSHDVELLSKLAENQSTSPEDLTRIYDSCKSSVANYNATEYQVFHSMAGNPKTPSDILVVLAQCPQTSIRVNVGMNPATPVQTLVQLAKDPDDLVRTWTTANPNTTKDLLLQLAADPDKIVRSYAEACLRDRGFKE